MTVGKLTQRLGYGKSLRKRAWRALAGAWLTVPDFSRLAGIDSPPSASKGGLEKRMVDDPSQSRFVRRTQYEVLAWLAALRGDRPAALTMLHQAEASPTIAMYPNGVEAVQLSCTKAAVYGFLRDVDTMLPFAQRCFTKANLIPSLTSMIPSSRGTGAIPG